MVRRGVPNDTKICYRKRRYKEFGQNHDKSNQPNHEVYNIRVNPNYNNVDSISGRNNKQPQPMITKKQ
ncbi:MAG: hypothetical protein AABY14_03670 [Nanoarchaeota archaeon]